MMRGLNVHTLDAWRKRVRQSGRHEEIVPVEIVEDGAARRDTRPPASVARSRQFQIVLAQGLRIEVEAGFDAAELQRLISALDSVVLRGGLPQSV